MYVFTVRGVGAFSCVYVCVAVCIDKLVEGSKSGVYVCGCVYIYYSYVCECEFELSECVLKSYACMWQSRYMETEV